MSNYIYNITDTYTNQVNIAKLQDEIAASAVSESVQSISQFGSEFTVFFSVSLTEGDETLLDDVVANHEHITTAESLKIYLNTVVYPFVEDLIATFASENIALGITPAGKTDDVLGLFEKKYMVGSLHSVSLKGSFDTGSLYVSLQVLSHIRSNPTEYTGLSPFVTDARLLEMMNKIEIFLGVLPLSE